MMTLLAIERLTLLKPVIFAKRASTALLDVPSSHRRASTGEDQRCASFNRLCYRCLSAQHIQSDCQSKEGCQTRNCSSPMSHHSLLHIEHKDDTGKDENVKGNQASAGINTHATSTMPSRNLVMLKVVPMRVVNEDGSAVTTYALLDSAAVTTMITSQLSHKLNLQGTPEKTNINTVVQSNHECILPSVSFDITPTTQEGLYFKVHRALVVENLNVPEQYCPNNLKLSYWPHLEDLDIDNVDVDLKEVSILVGQDVPQAHIVLDYCWGDDPPNQPYGMKHRLLGV